MKLTATQKLEKAYFEFLEEKHYSKLSVSEIIERAGVSRTTFYRNYVDIFDMHKKISDRFAEDLIKECVKVAIRNVLTTHSLGFGGVIKILTSQEKYILLLAGEHGSRYFFETLYTTALGTFSALPIHLSEDLIFRIKFIVGAIISFYVRDILEGREHDFDVVNISSKILDHEKIVEGFYGR